MIPLNVLVVDDSALTIRKIEASLSELGHRVIATASTGQEAIDAYAAHSPDLVTLDVTMPEMDGIQAVKEIIDRFPDASILMVTSNGLANLVLQALRSGAKGYVLKPINSDTLRTEIDKIFNRPDE